MYARIEKPIQQIRSSHTMKAPHSAYEKYTEPILPRHGQLGLAYIPKPTWQYRESTGSVRFRKQSGMISW